MARLFDDASNQYLSVGSSPVSGNPLTIACWFYTDDDTIDECAVHVGQSGTTQYNQILLSGSGSWNEVKALTRDASGATTASTTTYYSANMWHHACCIFTSNVLRAAYLDGGGKGTDNTDRTAASLDCIQVGRNEYSSGDKYSGRLAEIGIWDVALSDDEVAALAGSVSSTRIRPESLVAYWPLYGVGSPEPDYRGTYNLTLNNGPTQADHAPVQVPFGLDAWLPMGLVLLPHLGGIAWGEQHPTMGEMPEKWSTWSDGAGGSPTVDGDPDWGKLYLACTEEGRSLVYDLTNANPRWYTLTENRYGAGSGTATLQIRGDTDPFGQDDGEPPNWENYAAPILRSWRYVQARETH